MATLKYKTGSGWVKHPGWTSLATDVTGGKANDTNTFWRDHDSGIYFFDKADQINGQPSTYGYLINIKPSSGSAFTVQLWLTYDGNASNTGSQIWTRTTNINSSVDIFTDWRKHTTWSDIYPIGAIYISYTSTSPSTLFGGTWSSITTGVLRAKAANETGGSDTHTLTNAQLPKMDTRFVMHGAGSSSGQGSQLSNVVNETGTLASQIETASKYTGGGTTTGANSVVRYHLSFGNNEAHNNLPAYQNIYAWRRTA